jgi:hypothetical protein
MAMIDKNERLRLLIMEREFRDRAIKYFRRNFTGDPVYMDHIHEVATWSERVSDANRGKANWDTTLKTAAVNIKIKLAERPHRPWFEDEVQERILKVFRNRQLPLERGKH